MTAAFLLGLLTGSVTTVAVLYYARERVRDGRKNGGWRARLKTTPEWRERERWFAERIRGETALAIRNMLADLETMEHEISRMEMKNNG